LPKATVSEEIDTDADLQIPTARFFDIKNEFSDAEAPFPNTWPGEAAFNDKARKLGIHNESFIIAYDDHGIYSSARAWWMFKAMGHQNVVVLNGGRKAWKEAGYSLEPKTSVAFPRGNFKGRFNTEYFTDKEEVFTNIEQGRALTIDARAENRFKGLVEEPREGLRSGHIPGSVNLPYTDLLSGGKMRDITSIGNLLRDKAGTKEPLVFSCGSGITACVLALGAEMAGYKNMSVYDGSWTEWGSLHELPVETK
jgi:thiosulfate/3-mercaptopyruvate sulfurtransferase